jgi:hypothetical protein
MVLPHSSAIVGGVHIRAYSFKLHKGKQSRLARSRREEHYIVILNGKYDSAHDEITTHFHKGSSTKEKCDFFVGENFLFLGGAWKFSMTPPLKQICSPLSILIERTSLVHLAGDYHNHHSCVISTQP